MNVIETEGSETGKDGRMDGETVEDHGGYREKEKEQKEGRWVGGYDSSSTEREREREGGKTWWDVISEREKERETVNAVKQQRWKLRDEMERAKGGKE